MSIGSLALNPDGQELAWVREICSSNGQVDYAQGTLVVSNLKTGGQRVMPMPEPSFADSKFRLDSTGRFLAFSDVEVGSEVAALTSHVYVVDLATAHSVADNRIVPSSPGCALSNPQYEPRSELLLVERACVEPDGTITTTLSIVDSDTGALKATVVTLPQGHQLVGLSLDSSGNSVLYGLIDSEGAPDLFRSAHGHVVHIPGAIPSGATW